MHVTLHMAISIDGFIAKPDGDSSWVSAIDAQLFEARCLEAGCIVMGRQTFDQYRGEIYPVAGITNIVLTNRAPVESDAGVDYVGSPEQAIAKAKSKGHGRILLAGGGQTNAAFMKSGLIDEIFLSVHPVILGQGIKLFGDTAASGVIELIDTALLGEGLVQLHYRKK